MQTTLIQPQQVIALSPDVRQAVVAGKINPDGVDDATVRLDPDAFRDRFAVEPSLATIFATAGKKVEHSLFRPRIVTVGFQNSCSELGLHLLVSPDKQVAMRMMVQRWVETVRMLQARADGPITVCFATGNTMIPFYEELVQNHSDSVDWKRLVSFNLDEYVGLGPDHPASYRFYMDTNLFNHVPIPRENINFPDGLVADPVVEAGRYAARIRRFGGIGVGILGLGSDGHIAFIEPGTADIGRKTYVVDLAESTRRDNAFAFGGDINSTPRQAITMGPADIRLFRHRLLAAFGANKQEAVLRMLMGKVGSDNPGAYVRMPIPLFSMTDAELSIDRPEVHFYFDTAAYPIV